MESQPNLLQPDQSYHPKHHIKVYVWIALVVASFLLAINGYLYFLRLSYLQQGVETARQNEQMIRELRANRSPSVSSIQFEIPSDWKTYRNEEYGFEVRYPGDLQLGIVPDKEYNYLQIYKQLEQPQAVNKLEIVFDTAGSKNLDDIIRDFPEYSYSKIYLGNQMWIKGALPQGEMAGGAPSYRFIQNGYSVDATAYVSDDQFHIIDQILSTFRFIE